MEGGKGGGTGNYWPGFVDALTNVVIAMVFVIVVLAIALSFAAQLMGKRVAEEAIRRHTAAAAAEAASRPVAAQAPSRPTDSAEAPPSRVPPQRIAVQGRENPASAAGGRVQAAGRALQLDFADTALTLDDAAAAKLKEALAPFKADAARAKVQIVATGPDLQLSDNQRSAYVRVMAVRNELIDQGYAAERIGVRIDTAQPARKPAVTVSISPP
jgi:hypothetical protein